MQAIPVHTVLFAGIKTVNDMTEDLFYAEFDLDAIRNYREHEMMGNTFRKVKAYDILLSEKISYPFIRNNESAMS